MEPVSIIVTALALGAANGLKDVAEQSVKDIYTTIKQMIAARYTTVDLEMIERNPGSQSRQFVVEEELEAAGAGEDAQLLAEAEKLIEAATMRLARETMVSVGVELSEVEGGNLEIRRVNARDQGVIVSKSKLKDITISDIDATGSAGKGNKAKKNAT